MAGSKTNVYSEFMKKEVTIAELLKAQTLPIIVKAYLNNADQRLLYQNTLPENKEVFLQRVVRVKYARVKILNFHNRDKMRDDNGEDFVDMHDRFVDKHYLIPAKYNGKLKFVHRPGRRRRYGSVTQILEDPPRYITLWDATPALLCTPESEHVSVPAKSQLEVVRKVTRSPTQKYYLECSDGQTLYAFGEDDRLNCTAMDDMRFYNLFELVRTKLLPRVVQFDTVDPDDITHIDEALYSATLSVFDGPIELQGFVENELLVGWVRNEVKQNYEAVLIPRNLWSTLFAKSDSLKIEKEAQDYIERLDGTCDTVDFVEKSLYLMSTFQDEVIWLRRPDFKCENIQTFDTENGETGESLYPGPVVLLPQVKKKQSLFKKVHTELLRWFTSSDNDSAEKRRLRNETRRKTVAHSTKLPKCRYSKNARSHIPRSMSLRDMRVEHNNLRYTRRKYSDTASYMEFYFDGPGQQLQTTHPLHGRLSMSLDDIAYKTAQQSESTEYNKHDAKRSSETDTCSLYSEINDIPVTDETHDTRNDLTNAYATSSVQEPLEKSCSLDFQPTVPNSMETHSVQVNIFSGDSFQMGIPARHQNEDVFYNYSVVKTVECLMTCGMNDFAEQCKKHKLDGAFFRNFDFDVFQEEPFHLSKFYILKLKKIIQEGWRPS